MKEIEINYTIKKEEKNSLKTFEITFTLANKNYTIDLTNSNNNSALEDLYGDLIEAIIYNKGKATLSFLNKNETELIALEKRGVESFTDSLKSEFDSIVNKLKEDKVLFLNNDQQEEAKEEKEI